MTDREFGRSLQVKEAYPPTKRELRDPQVVVDSVFEAQFGIMLDWQPTRIKMEEANS